ncbi:hypothetical protein FACS1894139_11440 [Planctomycetales bacterium]|nr:hypothetical protein FACS1894107_02490 [Planctomycetales bacterium]GHS99422.1 hypothetical protein FACS1894108_09370 [Planctomycetales bacterium]GHT06187.1 hypothetical protein FACS1894139_11440 [Planctomycetales bacterium]GHV19340.1 hypothetical protein AGMMS49959_03990 [Planctomycetales bacterium]
MLKPLTISVEEALYQKLAALGDGAVIGEYVADLFRAAPHPEPFVYTDLDAGYRAMAADAEYEKEASEWVNAYMGEVVDE